VKIEVATIQGVGIWSKSNSCAFAFMEEARGIWSDFLVTVLGKLRNPNSLPARDVNFVMSNSYVVDAADHDNIPISRNELHDLLSKHSLNGIPLLVLGNKIDKPGDFSEQELMEQM
ncbi:hypothetical protein HN873_039622, partial [Arachis hypogaea]